jgi:hypothetical protein
MSIKKEVQHIFPHSNITAWKTFGDTWYPRDLDEARDLPPGDSQYMVLIPYNDMLLPDGWAAGCRKDGGYLFPTESEAWEHAYKLSQDYLLEVLGS